MKLDTDWHVHTRSSVDHASMETAELVRGARELGIADFGVTDHLNTRLNLPAIRASREEYLATGPGPRFHFGVEVSCVSRWEVDLIARGEHADAVWGVREGGPPSAEPAVDLTDDILEELGIEYVVAGVHWPLYVPMEARAVTRDYHRQLVFLASHPLVDVVAHPWWWMGGWEDADGRFTTDPWFDDFGRVPRSMHDEFASACADHGSAAEVNLSATLLTPAYTDAFKERYLEYVAGLAARGVCLAMGSDCHDPTYRIDFGRAERMLERAGMDRTDWWRLPPRGKL